MQILRNRIYPNDTQPGNNRQLDTLIHYPPKWTYHWDDLEGSWITGRRPSHSAANYNSDISSFEFKWDPES
jgi:hypothetical protein